MKKRKVNWEKYNEDIRKLACSIYQIHYKKPFDFITGIPRGGLVIAVHLSHLLKIPYIEFEDVSTKNNVLVCDDVSDTGKTLAAYWCSSKKDHHVATLYRKDHTIFEPLFSIETINEWIIFPWEE